MKQYMKTCRKCGTEKPKTEFYIHSETTDGLRGTCKACWKIQTSGWQEENSEKFHALLKTYRDENPEKRKDICRRYRKKHPEYVKTTEKWMEENRDKRNIHQRLNRAVKKGKLIKPSQCSSCGKAGYIEAHHDDYNKPFEVRWLCKSCHKYHHINKKLSV